jgi:hypothetical protein
VRACFAATLGGSLSRRCAWSRRHYQRRQSRKMCCVPRCKIKQKLRVNVRARGHYQKIERPKETSGPQVHSGYGRKVEN